MAGLLSVGMRAPAAGFVQTDFLVDNLNDMGMGSLRQAILDANANAGSDTVVFAAGLSGTIDLTSGEIPITDNLIIVGPGARVLTVDSNARIFVISSPMDQIGVGISGLTLAGGVAPLFGNGGGILVRDSRLGLSEVTMSGNAAASGEGGAISCTNGSVAIERSTLSGNNANKAGALHLVLCSLDDLTNSTVSGNMATDSVGGIKLEFSPATIRNSTVANNRAGGSQGGILVNQAPILNLLSSIVADNTDGAGGSDLVRFAPSTIDAEFSLIETPPAPNTINGDDIGNLIGVDPQLDPLNNNGGPTDTHKIFPASPAFNTGANEVNLTTDQRGEPYARTILGQTDIGAFEVQPGAGAPALSWLGLLALALALGLLGTGVVARGKRLPRY